MNRTLHTNDVAPRVKAAIEKLNSDGTLPPGVKLIPFYDRTTLVGSYDAHRSSQSYLWLRSGVSDPMDSSWEPAKCDHRRSEHSIRAVLQYHCLGAPRGEDANLLSVGAVDFGIIVDSAVIVVENIFRNCQLSAEARQRMLQRFVQENASVGLGGDRTTWTERLHIIFVSALQVDKAVFFSTAVTVAAFVPLFTMQGVEGQIFNPMARTYGYALLGALLATFTVTPVLASYLLPDHIAESDTLFVRALHAVYRPVLRWSLMHRKTMVVHCRRAA